MAEFRLNGHFLSKARYDVENIIYYLNNQLTQQLSFVQVEMEAYRDDFTGWGYPAIRPMNSSNIQLHID